MLFLGCGVWVSGGGGQERGAQKGTEGGQEGKERLEGGEERGWAGYERRYIDSRAGSRLQVMETAVCSVLTLREER